MVEAVALQTSSEPTNKVQASTNAAGGLGAVIAGVMAAYGGPAIVEMLGPWASTHPSATALLVGGLSAVAGFFVIKYGGQAAAYNVLDRPNQAMIPGPKP